MKQTNVPLLMHGYAVVFPFLQIAVNLFIYFSKLVFQRFTCAASPAHE